jgi:exosortase A
VLNVAKVTRKETVLTNRLLSSLVVLGVTWCLLFWRGITTAVDIWLESDIFNHCLFVLPGAFYLVYLNRQKLAVLEVRPNFLVLLPCAGCLLLYAIGLAGDLQIFMHVATFTFLPLAIWAWFGNKIAYQIMFPLFFILFCIPIGEELVPTLQQITADLSVVMLNWTSIPIFRSGLYIEIPQGRFLVAEACSGISFLIASIVIGCLYAYLNIRSTKRRVLFVAISILFPILANAVRVFGIIVIAYVSDMQYAVGADHLIYGWFFFAFVIICLLGIGELMRESGINEENTVEAHLPTSSNPERPSKLKMFLALQGVIYLLFLFWFYNIQNQQQEITEPLAIKLNLEGQEILDTHSGRVSAWEPLFPESFDSEKVILKVDKLEIDVFLAWYPAGHGELISSLNRVYQQESWTEESTDTSRLSDSIDVPLLRIVNSNETRLLSYWYVVDGKIFGDNKIAKLYEIYRVLLGKYQGGGVVALSAVVERGTFESDSQLFLNSVSELADTLNKGFTF